MTGFDDGWRRSTHCDTSACVAVKICPGERGGVLVRGRERVAISFDRDEWIAFVAGVKAGEFDWPQEAGMLDG